MQRVSSASVTVDHIKTAEIGSGLLILVGIEEADSREDCEWLASKIVNLRIFGDSDNVMNLSCKDVGGQIIVVSQFTLHALTKKGNRPSYIRAAKPEIAIPLYEYFIEIVQIELQSEVGNGIFGADMKVAMVNDGPVTILIDSKKKE